MLLLSGVQGKVTVYLSPHALACHGKCPATASIEMSSHEPTLNFLTAQYACCAQETEGGALLIEAFRRTMAAQGRAPVNSHFLVKVQLSTEVRHSPMSCVSEWVDSRHVFGEFGTFQLMEGFNCTW